MSTVVTPIATPTRLDWLRRRYVHGELELADFEAQVAELLESGREHEPQPAGNPPHPELVRRLPTSIGITERR